jgi:hypothetical protein
MEAFSIIGVYKWRCDDHVVREVASRAFSQPSARDVLYVREMLGGLVAVELLVNATSSDVDVGDISQTPPSKRDGYEQVAYDETYWDEAGTNKLAHAPIHDKLSKDELYRVIFFMHEWSSSSPLFCGDGICLETPKPTSLPLRLQGKLQYDLP